MTRRKDMALARADFVVRDDTVVARISLVPAGVFDPLEDHVLFDPADEVERALATAPVPVIKIDSGLVVDDEDTRAFGHALAQTLGLNPFEGAHVVLVQSLADGQVAQGVRPQVQSVEMSHGHPAAIVARVMHCRFVPMAIGGEAGVFGCPLNLRTTD